MCVIIVKPENKNLDYDDVANAYFNNPDGFGYMYADPKSQTVVHKKFVPDAQNTNVEDEIYQVFERLEDRLAVFHFRMATHGRVDDEMCHPFEVLNKEKHGVDLYMVHNGIISQHGYGKHHDDVSDTVEFIREIVRPILRRDPTLVFEPAFKTLVSEYIRTDKLVFLFGDGRLAFVNLEYGEDYKGCWVSNTYSFQFYNNYWTSGGSDKYKNVKVVGHFSGQHDVQATGLANEYAKKHNLNLADVPYSSTHSRIILEADVKDYHDLYKKSFAYQDDEVPFLEDDMPTEEESVCSSRRVPDALADGVEEEDEGFTKDTTPKFLTYEGDYEGDLITEAVDEFADTEADGVLDAIVGMADHDILDFVKREPELASECLVDLLYYRNKRTA